MKSEKLKIIEKIIKVIKSCKTDKQRLIAERYHSLATKQIYIDELDVSCILEAIKKI